MYSFVLSSFCYNTCARFLFPQRAPLPVQRKEDQKAVDAQLLAVVEKTPMLKEYLKAKFSLKQGQYPHMMKF